MKKQKCFFLFSTFFLAFLTTGCVDNISSVLINKNPKLLIKALVRNFLKEITLVTDGSINNINCNTKQNNSLFAQVTVHHKKQTNSSNKIKNSRKNLKQKNFSGIAMVEIPSSDTVKSFWMAKYETTQRQYRWIMGRNKRIKRYQPNRPVVNVNWIEAIKFCNRLSKKAGFKPCYKIDKNTPYTFSIIPESNGFRLPTVEEWLYAAKANTETAFYWGDAIDGDYCWHSKNTKIIQNVGRKKPNQWGLYDMYGNIGELCFDIGFVKNNVDENYINILKAVMGSCFRTLNIEYGADPISLYSYASYEDRSDITGFRIIKCK